MDKTFIRKDGKYFRANDSHLIQRYKCTHCLTRFSSSTQTLEYRQKKRRLNSMIEAMISIGGSQRAIARKLKISRETVRRKFHYLSLRGRVFLEEFKKDHVFKFLQLDDLITKEQTKLKPLSVSVLVEETQGFILGCEVSTMPASGHLRDIAIKKYGRRKNTHLEALKKLFSNTKDSIADQAIIKSDQHKNYPKVIKEFIPCGIHKTYQSKRARDDGLGEMKKGGFDPLFRINNILAQMRDRMSRLRRKTWCLTQKASWLEDHLFIFMADHNRQILSRISVK